MKLQEMGTFRIHLEPGSHVPDSLFAIKTADYEPVLPGTPLYHPFQKPLGILPGVNGTGVHVPEELGYSQRAQRCLYVGHCDELLLEAQVFLVAVLAQVVVDLVFCRGEVREVPPDGFVFPAPLELV